MTLVVPKAALGTLVAAAVLASPAAASAASLRGTVSASGSGAPLQGVEVCVTPVPYTFEVPCTETGGTDEYSLPDLPAATYIVDFSADRANLNYVSSFEDGLAYSFEAEADPVVLGAGEDRRLEEWLAEGGSIAGAVTDAGTGLPASGVEVCADGPAPAARSAGPAANTD